MSCFSKFKIYLIRCKIKQKKWHNKYIDLKSEKSMGNQFFRKKFN